MKTTLFDIVREYQQLYELATSEEEQVESDTGIDGKYEKIWSF